MMLRDVGEEGLLARISPRFNRNRHVVTGAGDDCAVVKFPGAKDFLLLKSDCVVEHVHFGTQAKARAVGWKAMMRTLSDFAAMSGIPQFAVITLAIDGKRKLSWVSELYRGLNHAAAWFDVAIVGGETSATEGPTVVAVSASGYVESDRCVRRDGGKAGDDLFVSGRLGGSGKDRHLKFVARIEEARWLTSHFDIHAMIDLSDGLGADLPRLARASKVGFTVDQGALPLAPGSSAEQAISKGEDYELLFAISPKHRRSLAKSWSSKFPKVALTRIGQLTRKSETGNQKFPTGYVHFRKRR